MYRACAQSFASEEGGGAFLGVAARVDHLKRLGVVTSNVFCACDWECGARDHFGGGSITRGCLGLCMPPCMLSEHCSLYPSERLTPVHSVRASH